MRSLSAPSSGSSGARCNALRTGVRVTTCEHGQHYEVRSTGGHGRDLHRMLKPENIRTHDTFTAEFTKQL